jgi:hypothetical protein
VFFVSRERYRRTSGRFGGTVGYIGDLWKKQERLGRMMHLPWVCHVRACFRLVAKLLPNCFLLFVRCSSQFALSFALSFLFWTYSLDNSTITNLCKFSKEETSRIFYDKWSTVFLNLHKIKLKQE